MPIYYYDAVLHPPLGLRGDLRVGTFTLCTRDSLKVLGLGDLFLDCSSVFGDDSGEIRGCFLFTPWGLVSLMRELESAWT